ncbi:MAG: diguanylate cyclase [Pseudomonas sp. PGPPP3]|nr:MAG: diguanylate cyclase [Pseudomonas sp. PGPPP3]
MHMPQHQTVIDALCQVINRQLPLPLQRLLDELMERLQQQRIHAGSNKEEQTYIDFLRVCKRLRNVVQLNAATSICQRLCHSVPLTTPPSDLSEWNLVDDIEVEAMLDIRRIARALRVPLGNLEWRVCNCLEQIDSGLKKDSDNPLSLEFLLHNVQAELRLHEQPGAIREVFYHCCVDVLGRDLKGYLEQLDGVFARFAILPRRAALSVTNTAPPHVHASTALNNSYQAIKQLTPLRGEARVANSAAQAVTLTQLQQALPHLQALPCPEHGWTAESFLGAMQAAGLQPSPQQCQDAQLVAELFQHIEHEEVIAPGVKPALRRLMAPVAQAVMLDPAAFADPLHPVRASLDKMMRLCDFAEPANLVLDRRMEQLIDQIVSEYQGDSRVFSRYDEQLEQLLAAQQRAYNNNAERVLQYHRGRDKLQQARRQVKCTLSEVLGSQIPKVLIEWLDAGWQELMVHALLRQGEQGQDWLDQLAVIRQLSGWLQTTPHVNGDTALAVERAYEVDQVLELLRRQVESLLPGQYQHIPVLQHLQLQLQGLEPIELIATPFSTEPDTVASLAPEQQRWHERLQQLSTGDWLSTESGQALQLIWANPANDHFVLADRQGHEAGSFNSLELMQRLASGWIGTSTTTPPNVVRDHLQSVVGQLYRDIAHARSHDELTGVYNRRSFEACVAQTINQYDSYAFIYGHIDQFSLLNSSCGPLAGDTYLKQLAALLRAQLPAESTLARIGGADFAVALPKTAGDQAYRVADKLRQAVESQTFHWQGQDRSLTMSLGLVLSSERRDVTNIFCDLQTACNAAKDSGRNRVHIYDETVDGAQNSLMAIASRVDGIIERGELSMRMQQIAPANSNHQQLPHYELLLVMENDINLLDFITAAERYHRMTKVDRWVLKRTFSELAEYPQVWQRTSGVSINLSGSSLNDDKLQGFIENLFEQYPVPPERICFELTETAAVANLTKTADFVRQLQKLGCTFSIDDFGTGFSSYEYLKRLPVDFVKIDGSFVKEIERSPSDLAMVKSINEIAHVLGRKTIAEYVETQSIREQLAALGVDYVQGYGVERPRPLSEYLKSC